MGLSLARPLLDAGIIVEDLNEALRFYRDTLGFAELGDIPLPGIGLVKRLGVGDSVLRLLEPETPTPKTADNAAFLNQSGLRYLTFEITNLDDAIADIKAAGFPVLVEPFALRPSVRVAQISDGHGVYIELFETQVP